MCNVHHLATVTPKLATFNTLAGNFKNEVYLYGGKTINAKKKKS